MLNEKVSLKGNTLSPFITSFKWQNYSDGEQMNGYWGRRGGEA
jgi:hypothetical protein